MKIERWILSLVLAISTSNLSAMKKGHEDADSKHPKQQFITLNDQQIASYKGSHDTYHYYKEYRPRSLGDNFVSFPLAVCDPVPSQNFGTSYRVFFTSAVEGAFPRKGKPVAFPADPLMEVKAVRAKSTGPGGSGWRVEIYFGYDPDRYEQEGKKRIFQAHILAVQTKCMNYTEYGDVILSPDVCEFSNQLMGLEVRKHLENRADWDWKSPVFWGILHKLLPQIEGAYFDENHQRLVSEICYWTKDENKLKKITYNSHS